MFLPFLAAIAAPLAGVSTSTLVAGGSVLGGGTVLSAGAGTVGAAGAAAAAGGTLAALANYAQVGGGVLSAAGMYQQYRAQQAAASRNAKLAEDQAKDAMQRGREDVRRKLLATGHLVGQQKAGLAASGVEPYTGSPLALMEDTLAMGDLDARVLARNAIREAAGYSIQRSNYLAEADMAGRRSVSAPVASLLTTGATVADRWYRDRS